ncbi:hypothetical protein LTS10_004377 [Elasticomyces elasticus]|nr:hypothetical protein LTS10_004377 [Elasticomyces elasticus]
MGSSVPTHDLQDAAALEATRVSSLNGSIHWYEHGNLLDLPEGETMRLLQAHPPKDAVHFGSHVQRWLSEDLKAVYQANVTAHDTARDMNPEGPNYFEWHVEEDQDFLPKRLRLIFFILTLQDGAVAAFHLFVWAKTHLLRNHWALPFGDKDLEELGNGVDEMITRLLWRHPSHHQPLGMAFKPSILDLGVLRPSLSDYYDAAKARRDFHREWSTWECSEQNVDFLDYEGTNVGPCWHAHNAYLIKLLDDRAHEEIEHNVRLAIQHVLPEELIEEVINYLLPLEEVPYRPEFRLEETGEWNGEYKPHCCYRGYIGVCLD